MIKKFKSKYLVPIASFCCLRYKMPEAEPKKETLRKIPDCYNGCNFYLFQFIFNSLQLN